MQSTHYTRWGKRTFDLAVSLVGLALLAVPVGVVSLAILFLHGRPIIFRQERVGRHARCFRICKFRTMRNGSDSVSSISTAGDSRITSVGQWLRRFKLDELPQLWNVMRGEMSLVGPRPDVPGYLDRLRGPDQALWELRPGITGPATLLFRREDELLASAADPVRFNDEVIYPEKVRLNLAYLGRCSFPLDLACVLATVVPPLSRCRGFHRFLGFDAERFESRLREAARNSTES